jgi:hypothetical protein
LKDVPVGETYDPRITARRSRRQPVSDRRLIPKVDATWRALQELGEKTEMMLWEKEAAVVGE